MSSTPLQTHLRELLQSAKWLGWEMPIAGVAVEVPAVAARCDPESEKAPAPAPALDAAT